MRRVFVPGFTLRPSSWDAVFELLPPTDESMAVAVPAGLDFAATALAIGQAGAPATYVGYSLGGRLCLRLALERPALVRRLVLVSASPGIADEAERARRRGADEAWARVIERDGVGTFYERWLAQPLFASLSTEAARLDDRDQEARVLTHGLRALGQGMMAPLWDRLDALAVPVALVVGGRDERYVAVAHAMAERIGDAHVEVIARAGHAVHLERPDAVAHALTS